MWTHLQRVDKTGPLHSSEKTLLVNPHTHKQEKRSPPDDTCVLYTLLI